MNRHIGSCLHCSRPVFSNFSVEMPGRGHVHRLCLRDYSPPPPLPPLPPLLFDAVTSTATELVTAALEEMHNVRIWQETILSAALEEDDSDVEEDGVELEEEWKWKDRDYDCALWLTRADVATVKPRRDETCAICLEPILHDKEKRVFCGTSCGHTFHFDCVPRVLRCPYCRKREWRTACTACTAIKQ